MSPVHFLLLFSYPLLMNVTQILLQSEANNSWHALVYLPTVHISVRLPSHNFLSSLHPHFFLPGFPLPPLIWKQTSSGPSFPDISMRSLYHSWMESHEAHLSARLSFSFDAAAQNDGIPFIIDVSYPFSFIIR